jgi:hypothetical protein
MPIIPDIALPANPPCMIGEMGLAVENRRHVSPVNI